MVAVGKRDGVNQTERAIEHEETSRSQFYWMSKDSNAWQRNQRRYSGRIAVDGSLSGIVNKHAAFGWGCHANGRRWRNDAVEWR